MEKKANQSRILDVCGWIVFATRNVLTISERTTSLMKSGFFYIAQVVAIKGRLKHLQIRIDKIAITKQMKIHLTAELYRVGAECFTTLWSRLFWDN